FTSVKSAPICGSAGSMMSMASAFSAESAATIATNSQVANVRVGAPAPSGIEAEVHHVAFADDVILAFEPHLARFFSAGLTFEGDVVVIGDGFGADEAFLEIAVDDARGLRRSPAFLDRPGARFLRADGEIGLQTKQIIAGVDELGE